MESTATDKKGIPESLLAVVGKTEKSFEDELKELRASLYLPTKYTGEDRSNLHKQLNPNITGETDRLLGTLTSPISYVDQSDDISIRTDEVSHSSKITFGSTTLNVPLGGATTTGKSVEAETVEAETIGSKPKPEALFQQDDSTGIDRELPVSMDHSNCENLKMEIHKNLKMHRLAADYFKFRNFVFFQAPQALLAMTSTLLAFMGAADAFELTMAKQVVTLAGCCSALVVVLQTLGGHCTYGTRASMHNGTTIYLRDLDDDLTLLMSKLRKLEMTKKKNDENTEQSKETAKMHEDTYESLQSRYRHSLKGCKSDVPTQITEAFSEIDSFIMLSRTTANRKYLEECGMFESQKFRGITLKSYDRLASNMVGYFYWPLKIPCPKALVKMTIDETRADLHQMTSFWETPPPPRKESIECLPFPTRHDAISKYATF